MAEEEVLFEQDRVRITTAKAQIHGTTYPMSGLTSVRTVKRVPATGGTFLLGMVGAVCLFFGLLSLPMMGDPQTQGSGVICLVTAGGSGALILGMAVLSHLTRGPVRWAVLLGTAGGDRQALVTADEDFADAVRQAIEDAITRRG